MSAGWTHTCGIESGNLYCWGWGREGQLGTGNTEDQFTPTRVGNYSNWTAISTGRGDHTCGIESGNLYCWGRGLEGQLGTGDNENQTSPTSVNTSKRDWTTVSAGSDHTCGIESEELYCWGENGDGQLGDKTNTNKNTPMIISRAGNWVDISASIDHTCGVVDSGSLYCWGDGADYKLGLGDVNNKNSPTQVGLKIETCRKKPGSSAYENTTFDILDWKEVGTGDIHTCGITERDGGTIYCWGDGGNGRLAKSEDTSDFEQPVKDAPCNGNVPP